jgi:4-amino-4-deoxy-L-arabinose transferase-like glycosyltransferase
MVDAWDGWTRGWRGPLCAALLALAAGAPAALTLPALDRDESRFAQATTQMLETGDFVNIQFQDQPRHKKPVGIHWLQAVSVGLVTEPETRAIWAYRIPSLLGAMLAAAACAWGARVFFGSGLGFAAGAILGVSILLSTEAFFAKTDAVLCGAMTLAMAALGRIYGAHKAGEAPRGSTVALFWAGMALAILVKGPVGPMIAGLSLLMLWAWDRELRWARGLQWWWGLVVCLLVFGPWAFAITVATDGASGPRPSAATWRPSSAAATRAIPARPDTTCW